jgi:phosphatidylinositol glycan class W
MATSTLPLKESFVSNLNGTTLDEIIFLAHCPPMLTVVSHLLLSFVQSKHVLWRMMIEIIVRCVGMVIIQSEIFFDHLKWLVIPVLILCTWILTSYRRSMLSRTVDKKLWCISEYRSAMLWGTVVAILAVDFQLFPRRFAKTEISGLSLMDLGVGSFVFAGGIVSPIARNPIMRNQSNISTLRQYLATFDWKLCILGLARLIAIWMFSYQSHVSEYGVHWNFFLTLFLLPIIPYIPGKSLLSILTSSYSVLLIHNIFVLYLMNGVSYILHAPRIPGNFFSQNREGMLSLLGFITIYKFGIETGKFIFKYNSILDQNVRNKKMCNLFVKMFILGLLCLLLCGYFNRYLTFDDVNVTDQTSIKGLLVPSRRLCNGGYVLLTIGYNLLLIALYGLIQYYIIDIDSTEEKASDKTHRKGKVQYLNHSFVVQATDLNGFFLFLFSNVMTGLINIIMGDTTVTCSITVGFIIVSAYTVFVALVLLAIKRRII